MKAKQANFWNSLENKTMAKNQVAEYLIAKLGQPSQELSTNLLKEILKRINTYYFTEEPENNTIFSLTGAIAKAEDVLEKKQKEGRRMGQTYYVLKIATDQGTEQLQARGEDLTPAKFSQIQRLAILGQNLVFKYKKWITNKQIIDFYPLAKNKQKILNKRSGKSERLEVLKRSDKSEGLFRLLIKSDKAETG